jgi:N-acyl-D-amino-acid deacylase
MDFVIENAKILDSESKKIITGFIAVVDDRIIETGLGLSSIPHDRFERVIDAEGQFLLPGFFDVHSRADLSLIADPLRLSALSQGILLEVIGQDGLGVAPISKKNYLTHYQYVSPSLGNSQLEWKWESVFNYLDKLNNKVSSNVLFYAPYGTMRLEASFNSKLSSEGESALVYILERAMDEGAIGLSISTYQAPSVLGWLDTNEFSPLLKVLSRKKGILSVDVDGSKNVLKDIEKAIILAKNYGLRLHINRVNISDDLTFDKFTASIDKVKKDLPSILVDVSPHTGKLLTFMDFLPTNFKGLSGEELRVSLKRGDVLKKKLEDSGIEEEYIESSKLITTSRRDMKKNEGSKLIDIALEQDMSVYEVLLKFLEFDAETSFFEYETSNKDVLKKMFSLDYVLPATKGCVKGQPVPEIFSSIPLYCNDFANMDIASITKKLSDKPSEFYGIKWGLKPGVLANFILINPDNFTYVFDYKSVQNFSKGVSLAVVNGKIIMDNDKFSSFRSGRVLSWL